MPGPLCSLASVPVRSGLLALFAVVVFAIGAGCSPARGAASSAAAPAAPHVGDDSFASAAAGPSTTVAEPEGPPAHMMMAEEMTYGDDPVLDRLWDHCQAGSGAACERLFRRAPVGSSYEAFGLSCGERPGIVDCERQLIDSQILAHSDLSSGVAIEPDEATEPVLGVNPLGFGVQ